MVTKFNNLTCLYDFTAMETTVVQNNFPKTIFVVATFLRSVKNNLYTIYCFAMVTKFNHLSGFYDFFAMETTVVLILFQKNYIFFTTFFISKENDFCYTIVVVVMFTNMITDTKWHTLHHLVSSPLKGTLYHLVSCGGSMCHYDT